MIRWLKNIVFYCLLLPAFCIQFLPGCNETFQPLQENDTAPFSMQGFVDASADTQWLRIVPAREQLAQPPVKPQMKVILEHVETGNSIVMNDTLFQDPRGLNFVNVWAEMDVEPGQTYRLTAERPDGATSTVSVSTPPDFPSPTWQGGGRPCSGGMIITGVEHLADVKSVWIVRFYFSGRANERYYAIPYRSKAFERSEGGYSVYINTTHEFNKIFGGLLSPPDSFKVIQRDIFVASGGPEWSDEISSLDELVYSLPGQFSNVENGVGYVIGIVSKTIPLDHCF
jgi:hypothetical protein